MITEHNKVFQMDTEETSYLFRILPSGQLEHLYYGTRIHIAEDVSPLTEKHKRGYGDTVAYSQEDSTLCLDQLCLEFSGVGKGDLREPAIELSQQNGCFVTDFCYHAHKIYKGKEEIPGLPSAYGDCDTLELTLCDKVTGASAVLFYHVFANCNVITRHMTVTAGKEPLALRRAMSLQIDLPESGYTLVTLNGAWARENQLDEIALVPGRWVNDSKSGISSDSHNPFIMLKTPSCTENYGNCYGFNLIYSGNHCEIAETSSHGRTRVLCGINPFCFENTLAPGGRFDTPEAVMTVSNLGMSGVSTNMHHFVRENIVRGEWKNRPRPVLVNSWEANYFDFDENRLVEQAKRAAVLGAELYVVDDGWFGHRDDDTTSLGDWFVNTKKLPNGVAGLADRFAQIPIALGIWIEPEMVSVDSELYRKHPDWALATPNTHSSMGRNQLVLDISRDEVSNYIIETISTLIDSADIAYIKWDMNRNLSDICSAEAGHNGDYYHRYVLGFYRIAKALTQRFPKVLFEGCAGGGKRFDLGVLCYMPQIWLSDNTDAICRVAIQTGAGYGYPQSTMGAHLSVCPNHQTGRTTPLNSRFNIAAFGLLGYELDVTRLSEADAATMSEQITFYKQHRQLLQYGELRRLEFPSTDNFKGWMIVSADQDEALVLLCQELFQTNQRSPILRLSGLDSNRLYSVRELSQTGQYCVAYGDLLCRAGIRLNRISPTLTHHDGLLALPDFGTALYWVKVQ